MCLGCVPERQLIHLIEHLVRTRCISRLQRLGRLGTRAYFNMGSALLPNWQHMHRLQQSRVTNLVCPVVLPTSSSTNRMQLRSSVVVRGHGAKHILPRVLVKSQLYRKQSIDSNDTSSLLSRRSPRTQSRTKLVVTHSNFKSAVAPSSGQSPRQRVNIPTSSGLDESSLDGGVIDIQSTASRPRRSVVGQVYTTKPLVRPSLGNLSTAVYPVHLTVKPHRPFDTKIYYPRRNNVKPLCFVSVPGTQKKKWLLRRCFESIQIQEQYHPQVLTTTRTLYTMEETKEKNNEEVEKQSTNKSLETQNQFNSFKSKLKHTTEKNTSASPHNSHSRNIPGTTRHNRCPAIINTHLSIPVTNFRNLTVDVTTTCRKRKNLYLNAKTQRTNPKGYIKLNSCSHGEINSSSSDKILEESRLQIEPHSLLVHRKRPTTPPYTPVWASEGYDTEEIVTDTVESMLSTFLSDLTLEPSTNLPHPTPEALQFGMEPSVSNPELIEALALEWSPPHRNTTQNPQVLELVLPPRLSMQHIKAHATGLRHIENQSPSDEM